MSLMLMGKTDARSVSNKLEETWAMTELGSPAAEWWKVQKAFLKSGWGVRVCCRQSCSAHKRLVFKTVASQSSLPVGDRADVDPAEINVKIPTDVSSIQSETKGKHSLWKSNHLQTCEHKVRLRESDALQIRRHCVPGVEMAGETPVLTSVLLSSSQLQQAEHSRLCASYFASLNQMNQVLFNLRVL
ncbi:hypothetical protein Q9966_002986 [Columba livia]|nr:hypothetical protein Q9966_002986 [Columba livia]